MGRNPGGAGSDWIPVPSRRSFLKSPAAKLWTLGIAIAVGLALLAVWGNSLAAEELERQERAAFQNARPVVPSSPTTLDSIQLSVAGAPSVTAFEWTVGNETQAGKGWMLGRLAEGTHDYSLKLEHSKFGTRYHNGTLGVEYKPDLVVKPAKPVFGQPVTFFVESWGSTSPANVTAFIIGDRSVVPGEHTITFPMSQAVPVNAVVELDDGRTFDLEEQVTVLGRASIRASPSVIEEGGSISYIVSYEGIPSPSTVTWTSSGGNTHTGEIVTWRYPNAGTFSVSVAVTGPDGARAEATEHVEVKAIPEPDYSNDAYILRTMEVGAYEENVDADAREEVQLWISLFDENGKNVKMDGTLDIHFTRGYGCGEARYSLGECNVEIRSGEFEKTTVGLGAMARERIVWSNYVDTDYWPCPSYGDSVEFLFVFTTEGGQEVRAKDDIWWSC